jgi:RNA polymerase sigma-70 factor (ECF subfamily)
MDDTTWLAERFEEHRDHLRGVAYRMLGSLAEAEDAVQEAWLRTSRADTSDVSNLGGWLTTVVARVCLNMLRSRATRRENTLDFHVPDPVVSLDRDGGPEHDVVMADSVGIALLVVLETLTPAERMAFVLHDLFGVAFDEIATIIERSPAAARQLASRARRRVRGAAPVADTDLATQRRVVDAFFAAAHNGDFEGLLAVLDPDVVVRADFGPTSRLSRVVHGAREVAGQALMFASPTRTVTPATVNGAAGVVVTVDGRPFSLMAFTVTGGRIVAIDAIGDRHRVAQVTGIGEPLSD